MVTEKEKKTSVKCTSEAFVGYAPRENIKFKCP
jgi:hypothetical protein